MLIARTPDAHNTVGALTFGLGPSSGAIRTTNYWTHLERRRKGTVTQLGMSLRLNALGGLPFTAT